MYASPVHGVLPSRRYGSPNGPNSIAIQSASTAVECAPQRYFGVWKTKRKASSSSASGCWVFASSGHVCTTFRYCRVSTSRLSTSLPYASGPFGTIDGCFSFERIEFGS